MKNLMKVTLTAFYGSLLGYFAFFRWTFDTPQSTRNLSPMSLISSRVIHLSQYQQDNSDSHYTTTDQNNNTHHHHQNISQGQNSTHKSHTTSNLHHHHHHHNTTLLHYYTDEHYHSIGMRFHKRQNRLKKACQDSSRPRSNQLYTFYVPSHNVFVCVPLKVSVLYIK